MSELWTQCRLHEAARRIKGVLFRIVESQEQVATNGLVDSLEEQSVLEEMLEGVKPPVRAGSDRLHYILMTPFRYPPLKYGSRYGRRHEPSLFYGSLSANTALAECAYYRLLFWHGMATPPPKRIQTRHTLFQAQYAAKHGLQLQHAPCDGHRRTLAHPADYSQTQALGSAMREAGIEAFEFPSARDPDGGENVALFGPSSLASKAPTLSESLWCQVNGERVTFLNASENSTAAFQAEHFFHDGRLPQPAL
ncbi:RES family NAD+ phosphorylase [Thiohalomonas denitrificans]|uniref:RES domain-containing protein n=1 Tax=Thiohalomonas denitrificans TaxID=415747 RepID=A0A1G5R4Z5_9GAMM|nr:RES family NAD+ phosphorylase [Thiohalomonas denitrificans]SCZ68379.1 RES domain-containing protein [Thiohalomonas denitrificans]